MPSCTTCWTDARDSEAELLFLANGARAVTHPFLILKAAAVLSLSHINTISGTITTYCEVIAPRLSSRKTRFAILTGLSSTSGVHTSRAVS